jgi:hypothetical protein
MALFKARCTGTKHKSKKKTLRTYSEKDGSRTAVLEPLGEAVRTHYDRADLIADDVARLGYDGASEILRALLPQSKRARSGDLGEILASDWLRRIWTFVFPSGGCDSRTGARSRCAATISSAWVSTPMKSSGC